MGEHYLSKFLCALRQYKIFFLIIKNGSTWKTVPDNDEDLQEQPPDPPEPTETEVENEPEIIENEPEIAEIQPEIIEHDQKFNQRLKNVADPRKNQLLSPSQKSVVALQNLLWTLVPKRPL